MAKDKEDSPPIISRQTLMPIGLVVSLVIGIGAVLIAYFDHDKEHDEAIASMRSASNERLMKIEHQLELLRRDIKDNTDDRWSKRDMEQLWAIFCANNQSLQCPEVD